MEGMDFKVTKEHSAISTVLTSFAMPLLVTIISPFVSSPVISHEYADRVSGDGMKNCNSRPAYADALGSAICTLYPVIKKE